MDLQARCCFSVGVVSSSACLESWYKSGGGAGGADDALVLLRGASAARDAYDDRVPGPGEWLGASGRALPRIVAAPPVDLLGAAAPPTVLGRPVRATLGRLAGAVELQAAGPGELSLGERVLARMPEFSA